VLARLGDRPDPVGSPVIYPGSLIVTDAQRWIYRKFDSSTGMLLGRCAQVTGPFLVIAVCPEAFSDVSRHYIAYVVSRSACGWAVMHGVYEQHEP